VTAARPLKRIGTRKAARTWGLVTVGALGVVSVAAGMATMGVLPGEAVLRDAMHSISSYELRTLARAIRPFGTWAGLVPGLLLLLATSSHARRRWWLWGLALVAAPLAGEALQELVGRLRPRGSALGFQRACYRRRGLRRGGALCGQPVRPSARLPHRDRARDRAGGPGHRRVPDCARRALAPRRPRRVRAGCRGRGRSRVVGCPPIAPIASRGSRWIEPQPCCGPTRGT
jgi:hypothetical protein